MPTTEGDVKNWRTIGSTRRFTGEEEEKEETTRISSAVISRVGLLLS